MSKIGTNSLRVDANSKVRGKTQYVDDIFIRNMLHAKILRSSIAHGRVKHIDTSKALKLPGVELILTYEDVPKHTFPTAGHPYALDASHRDVSDRNILTGHIRYWGDEIAAVAAVDEHTAEKALALIEVEYEEYIPILQAEAALQKDAVEIHEGTGNIIGCHEYNSGEMEQALASADFIFEQEYNTSIVQHCAMENHSAFAYIVSNDRIIIYSSTQIPHICRRIVGQALGLPWGRIRVVKPYIGGGFGSKQDVVVEPLAAILSLKLQGRPVKVELSREETFIATRTRHAIKSLLKSGVTSEGLFTARSGSIISTNGAYASHGHSIAGKCGDTFCVQYTQRAIHFDAVTVYTNLPTAGAMRAYGGPQMLFAMECHMDDLAKKLGLDGIEFRLRNLPEPGFTNELAGITDYSNGLRECAAKGKQLIGWDEKKARYFGQTGSMRRGLGTAFFHYPAGTYPHGQELASARIIVNQDGSVQLQVGATEIGQGSDTVFAQMAAETIGIPLNNVHIISEQDTDVTPFDTGSYASRQSYVSGMAVKKAALEVKAKLLERCCIMTNLPIHSLDTADGWVVFKHNQEKLLPIADVALDSYYNLKTAAPITADISHNTRITTISYGCTFVEVEVDILTGKVAIIELYNIHDSGKIINHILAQGQVHGGVSMGLGYALYEQLLFDTKSGKPLNNNLLDYKLMTATDTPEIEALFVETFDPTAPYGNKPLGEPPAIGPAPAIRNAILDATGVHINELPLTPQRLFEKFVQSGLIRMEARENV
ncbi:xanthine dehydrogenase subunit XdhA [Dendrosporobacter sp. 1207_IL3150]|uniref:xanthine dehydrogenase subunit XdhA n=1 Tax=Dendrosporobacter sp. 1207_IL3150 TaxID=3084054 RepID=UPI002FDABF88